MKRCLLLSLAALGAVGLGRGGAAFGQALPPGQEAEGAVARKPPFYGISLDLNVWNQSGLWGGIGSYRYRNDIGFLPIPNWAVGRRFIGKGPFRTLTLQGRFFWNAPVSGFDESNYTGDAPPAAEQQPCTAGRSGSLTYNDAPICPWTGGPKRADYSDLTLILANPRIYTVPRIGVRLDPSFILTLPVSAQSRLRTLVLQAVLQLGASRSFWKNRIDVAYTFGYGQPFFRYATAGIRYDGRSADLPYVGASGLSNFYAQFDGAGNISPGVAAILCEAEPTCRNPTLFLQHTVRGTLNIIDPLSFTIIYRISNSYVRNPGSCAETIPYDFAPPILSCSTTFEQQPSGTWRDRQLFWAMLNYQALPWLGVSASLITDSSFWAFAQSAPGDTLPGVDGPIEPTRSYRQGIVSVLGTDFTSVSVGVDISIDGLASKFLRK